MVSVTFSKMLFLFVISSLFLPHPSKVVKGCHGIINCLSMPVYAVYEINHSKQGDGRVYLLRTQVNDVQCDCVLWADALLCSLAAYPLTAQGSYMTMVTFVT